MPFLTQKRDPLEDARALLELARAFLTIEDPDELLDALVLRSLAVLGGDRGFLVLKEADKHNFKVIKNWSPEELLEQREEVSKTLLREVFSNGKLLHVSDVEADPRLEGVESIQDLQVRSVLAAPLYLGGEMAGALYLESRSNQFYYGGPERALFEQILDLSSRILDGCTRRLLLEKRAHLLERDFLSRYQFPGILTKDPGFLKILKTVAQVAKSAIPVVIQGPSGTGKELIARALYVNSERARQPFLTINCSAISPTLMESELFGHVKGAFTGATQNKQGLIAAAHKGTLFLDEIGELPREMQAKFLRTLQSGEVVPVGSTRAQTYDVRFLAATNRDLEEEVREGGFREDLLYRLNAVVLQLPSLQERRGDILPLFYHFLQKSAEQAGREGLAVGKEVEEVLLGYPWPGNIRELENEARRLLALTPPGEPASRDRLSPKLSRPGAQDRLLTMAQLERQNVELHMKAANGNRTAAASTLGLSREGLRKMLIRYGLA